MKIQNVIKICLFVFFGFIATNSLAQEEYLRENIIIKASRNLLFIDNNIKTMTFDLSKMASTNIQRTTDDTVFIKQTIDFEGNTAAKNSGLVRVAPQLKSLFVQYKPEYLTRIFSPPFDTVQKNFRGELVKVPDLSLHYRIKVRSHEDQQSLTNELKRLPGILAVSSPLPPEKVYRDGEIPPEEEYYSN